MTAELTRYQFFLSSKQRNSGTITDCNFNLRTPVSLKAYNSAFFLQVNSVEIPFSFYQLNNEINTLSCTFKNGLGTKNSNINLDQGNYNCNSILNLLKDKLITEAQISSGLYTGFTPNFSFSYSSSTGRMTYLMSNIDCEITLKFSENKSLGIFYGFDTNMTISSVVITSAKYCVANPVTSLYVRSPTFKQINNSEFIIETDVYSDIIKQVPVFTGQNTYIQDFSDADLIYISNSSLSEFNIYLSSNLSYSPIDLQGLEWSITFTLIEMIQPDYKPVVPIVNTFMPQITDEGELSSMTQEITKYKDMFEQKINRDKDRLEKLLQKQKNRTNNKDKDVLLSTE